MITEPPRGYEGFTGFITGKIMKEVLGNVSGKTFYVCGPEAMYAFCLPELLKLQVPGKKIRYAPFS